MTYLVMECHAAYAVVLSEDGQFLKVANLRYEVGQTVRQVTELRTPQPVTPVRRSWRSGLVAAAACLVLLVTSFFVTGQLPYASVYMTINPEVRIDVNRKDVVLTVEGVNADGSRLLTGYDPERKDLDTVMDELVDRAIRMGYLHEGGTVTLTLDGSDRWVSTHSTHLNDHLEEYLSDRITVTVDIGPAPEAAAPPPGEAPAPIAIPIGPDPDYADASDYGESDYGDSDYADSGYGDSDYRSSSGHVPSHREDSDYGDSDYSVASDYGAPAEAESPYEAESDYEVPAAAESAYEAESGYASSAEAESDYESVTYVPPVQEAAPYVPPAEAESGYDAGSDYADAQSDYDASDYEISDYDD